MSKQEVPVVDAGPEGVSNGGPPAGDRADPHSSRRTRGDRVISGARLPTELATPTAGVIAERVRAATRSIAARSDEIEAARDVPTDLIEQMRQWGLFRLWLPTELGGAQAAPLDALQIVEALAHADAAVGWCAMIAIANNAVASLLPRRGARAVFATGNEITAGAFMARGRAHHINGAYRLSGQWSFGSGISHSDWVCGGAVVTDDTQRPNTGADGTPEVRLFFVAREHVEILDTWDVTGLRGTGSHDYRITGATVPIERSLVLARPEPWAPGPLWRIPVFTLLFPLMASVPLGIARRAIDELIALAVDKVGYGTSKPLRERDVAQATIARAEAAIGAARSYLHDAVTHLWQLAQGGDQITLKDRALTRLAVVNAGQAAAEATRTCYHAAGATALNRKHPLQRAFRDAHAATQHYVLAHSGYETVGKVLFGLSADGPL